MRTRVMAGLLIILFTVPAAAWIAAKNIEVSFVTFFCLLLIFMMIGLFVIKRDITRQDQTEIWKTDKMTDGELEEYVRELLIKQGCHAEKPTSHEEISFLLKTPAGKTAAVKVKTHKQSVGIRLVQKAFKASHTLKAEECWIISNNDFTSQAKEFARENNIRLYGRDQLISWILTVNKGKASAE